MPLVLPCATTCLSIVDENIERRRFTMMTRHPLRASRRSNMCPGPRTQCFSNKRPSLGQLTPALMQRWLPFEFPTFHSSLVFRDAASRGAKLDHWRRLDASVGPTGIRIKVPYVGRCAKMDTHADTDIHSKKLNLKPKLPSFIGDGSILRVLSLISRKIKKYTLSWMNLIRRTP